MDKLNLLLIEDDPDDVMFVRETLRTVSNSSYQLLRAERLETGLEYLASTTIDLILLDLSLPDNNGLAAVQKIRAKQRNIPIVVLTGLNDHDLAKQAIHMGAQDYLVKGHFDEHSLDGAIRNGLERHRLLAGLQASEMKLRQIIENNADSMIVVDRQGTICFANPAARALFGKEEHSLVGELFGFPVTSGDSSELEIPSRQGKLAIVEMRTTELNWESKGASLVSLHDITEREQAREALARHNTILQAISVITAQFLRTADLDKSVQSILAQIGKTLAIDHIRIYEIQFREKNIAGASLRYNWSPLDVPTQNNRLESRGVPPFNTAFERWQIALKQGQCIYGSIQEFAASEQAVLASQGLRSIALVPIFVGEAWWGFIEYRCYQVARTWLAMEIDVLRVAAGILGAAIQRKRSENAEKRLLEMKDEFIATASHELRTPLCALQGFLDLLHSGAVEDPATQREFLDIATKNAKRLTTLVEDLVDITNMESNRLRLDMEEVDLGPLIADALDSLKSLADEKEIVLSCTIPHTSPEASFYVWADPKRVRQVLINLIGNAIKFSDARQPVAVSAQPEAEQISVRVADHGPGIATEDLPRLFTKFFRANNKATRSAVGAGLGLYTSKGLIEAQGGAMRVESKLGIGSTFIFTLPRAKEKAINQKEKIT